MRPLRGPSGEFGAHGVVDIEQDASRVYDFMCQVREQGLSQQQEVRSSTPDTYTRCVQQQLSKAFLPGTLAVPS